MDNLKATDIGDVIQDYLDKEGFTINNQTLEHWESLIKHYAQIKCEEQRHLCAKHGKDDKVEVDKETGEETLVEYSSDYLILSAPEPEFD